MKSLLALLLIVLFSLPGVAFAQNEKEEEFVTFDELNFKGERRVGIDDYWDGVPRAHFERLHQIKKSFMSNLKSTANDKALN